MEIYMALVNTNENLILQQEKPFCYLFNDRGTYELTN